MQCQFHSVFDLILQSNVSSSEHLKVYAIYDNFFQPCLTWPTYWPRPGSEGCCTGWGRCSLHPHSGTTPSNPQGSQTISPSPATDSRDLNLISDWATRLSLFCDRFIGWVAEHHISVKCLFLIHTSKQQNIHLILFLKIIFLQNLGFTFIQKRKIDPMGIHICTSKPFYRKRNDCRIKIPIIFPLKRNRIFTTGRVYSSLLPKQDSKMTYQWKNCSAMKILCRNYLAEVEHYLHVFFDSPNLEKEIFLNQSPQKKIYQCFEAPTHSK